MDDTTGTRPRTTAATRSCAACRRRKIKCNREQPCNYCTKLRLECTYSVSEPEASKSTSHDLLTRLGRIETTLQRIEAHTATCGNRRSSMEGVSTVARDSTHRTGHAQIGPQQSTARSIAEHAGSEVASGSLWTESDNEMGIDGPHNDVPAIKDNSSVSATGLSYHGLIFGIGTMSTDTVRLHPAEDRIFALWQVFIESVDPLIKMIHVPTIQRQLLRACQDLTKVSPAFESLMFAIYYAAVISMQSSVSNQTLSIAERRGFLQRYGTGVVQCLTKADFMRAPDVTLLQALTIYLTCARQVADKMYIWTMTGLLIRLAVKLDLHRDPAALGLRPFLCEMRRRLWWQICILDIRTAEETDMEPSIYEHAFDTKFPTNINDSDLDTNMGQSPTHRETRTEMMFTLTRLEISYAARKLVFSPEFSTKNGYECLSTQQKNDVVDALLDDVRKRYFHDSDSEIPICFFNSVAAEMVLIKLKLTINHVSIPEASGMARAQLEGLVQGAISIVDYAHALRSDQRYSRWIWLFQKYVEWDAAAFLLHSMNAIHTPALVEKAWNVMNRFFEQWSARVPAGEHRWQRLQGLRAQAADRQAVFLSAVEENRSRSVAALNGEHRNVSEGACSGDAHPREQSFAFDRDIMSDIHDSLGQDDSAYHSVLQETRGSWSMDGSTSWSW